MPPRDRDTEIAALLPSVYRELRRDIENFYGEEAVVRTKDGARFLKTITRGKTRGSVTLLSFNARPIENVKFDWIGEIYITVRSGKVRRSGRSDTGQPVKIRARR